MNVDLIKSVDKIVGGILCLILSLFSFGSKKEVKKVLVIQFWGIGETVCTLPALKMIKEDVEILCTDRVKDVFSGLGYKLIVLNLSVFSILKFMIRNYKKYDLVIDMEEYLHISSIISLFVGKYRRGYSHGVRSLLYNSKVKYNDEQHVVYAFTDLIKKNVKVKALEKLFVSLSDKKIIDDYLKGIKGKKVGIVVGAAESGRSRMWPKERFALLADELSKKYKVIFIGSPSEKDLISEVQSLMKKDSINSAGSTSLKQSFYLISKMDLFISNDTGPMHVAAAQGVKTIGLFGPNLPLRFGPFGSKNIGIYKGESCKYSPCINVHKGQIPGCLLDRYQECMKNISVDDVLDKI